MAANDPESKSPKPEDTPLRHEPLRPEIQEILDRAGALPILDDRTDDEILGYDENGLPS